MLDGFKRFKKKIQIIEEEKKEFEEEKKEFEEEKEGIEEEN